MLVYLDLGADRLQFGGQRVPVNGRQISGLIGKFAELNSVVFPSRSVLGRIKNNRVLVKLWLKAPVTGVLVGSRAEVRRHNNVRPAIRRIAPGDCRSVQTPLANH